MNSTGNARQTINPTKNASATRRFSIFSKLNKILQVKISIPHYINEFRQLRSFGELYSWLYFKLPYRFSLIAFPPYVSVELTNKCNFTCKHCWRETMDRPEGFMKLSLFKKIASELSQYKHINMKILGLGEATLHPHFSEFMATLDRYTFRVLLYTNGFLFNLFSYDEILTWRLDRIIFSIDGTDADSYEQIKKRGRYQKLKTHIENLYTLRSAINKKHPIIEIRHVIMPGETESQLKNFRQQWLKTADTVKFNVCEPSDGRSTEADDSPPRCRSIYRERGILWDGNIPVCGGAYRDMYSGNVNHSSITDLWRHPKLDYLRKANRQRHFHKIPECAKCLHCR